MYFLLTEVRIYPSQVFYGIRDQTATILLNHGKRKIRYKTLDSSGQDSQWHNLFKFINYTGVGTENVFLTWLVLFYVLSFLLRLLPFFSIWKIPCKFFLLYKILLCQSLNLFFNQTKKEMLQVFCLCYGPFYPIKQRTWSERSSSYSAGQNESVSPQQTQEEHRSGSGKNRRGQNIARFFWGQKVNGAKCITTLIPVLGSYICP